MTYTDTFSYDEKLVLNSVGLYKTLKDCIYSVLIQSTVTQDLQAKDVYLSLHAKLKNMNESEWNETQKHMPFAVPYGQYDEEEEQEYTEYSEWSDEDYAQFIEMIGDMNTKYGNESEGV